MLYSNSSASPYKCSVCGGTFVGGHYCVGKTTATRIEKTPQEIIKELEVEIERLKKQIREQP